MTRNSSVTWHKRKITQESCLTLEIPDGKRRRLLEDYATPAVVVVVSAKVLSIKNVE